LNHNHVNSVMICPLPHWKGTLLPFPILMGKILRVFLFCPFFGIVRFCGGLGQVLWSFVPTVCPLFFNPGQMVFFPPPAAYCVPPKLWSFHVVATCFWLPQVLMAVLPLWLALRDVSLLIFPPDLGFLFLLPSFSFYHTDRTPPSRNISYFRLGPIVPLALFFQH